MAGDLLCSGNGISGTVTKKTKMTGEKLPQRSDPRPVLVAMGRVNIYGPDPILSTSQMLTRFELMATP